MTEQEEVSQTILHAEEDDDSLAVRTTIEESIENSSEDEDAKSFQQQLEKTLNLKLNSQK